MALTAAESALFARFATPGSSLDRGPAGDRLDLEVALAPRVAAYAMIATERLGDPGRPRRKPLP